MMRLVTILFFYVFVSTIAVAQPSPDYNDDDPPKLSTREENAVMKNEIRAFMIGGIVAFICYQIIKDGMFAGMCGFVVIAITSIWGGTTGIIAGVIIILFMLKK